MGVPEGQETERGAQRIFEESVDQNFPNLMKNLIIQIQKAQQALSRLDSRKSSPRYVLVKLSETKEKEKLLIASGEK